MRKESRAMDSGWALEVMHKAPYITVSFIDEDGKPYGLPLSLASDDDVNWYFHGALEGKKMEAIKAHPEVCLSAVTRCAPTVGPKDGSFTLQFKSAIAFGKAEIVTEDAEKIHGLRLICERFLPHHMDAFDQSIARSLSRTAIVRITLTEPLTSCKLFVFYMQNKQFYCKTSTKSYTPEGSSLSVKRKGLPVHAV